MWLSWDSNLRSLDLRSDALLTALSNPAINLCILNWSVSSVCLLNLIKLLNDKYHILRDSGPFQVPINYCDTICHVYSKYSDRSKQIVETHFTVDHSYSGRSSIGTKWTGLAWIWDSIVRAKRVYTVCHSCSGDHQQALKWTALVWILGRIWEGANSTYGYYGRPWW